MRSVLAVVVPGAFACCLAACRPAAVSRSSPDHLTRDDSVRVSVLSYRLSEPAPGGASVACIAVAESDSLRRLGQGADPSPQFLALLTRALDTIPLAVRPRSACRRVFDPLQGHDAVSEIGTNATAIDEWVSVVVWQTTSRAEVESGYWCGSRCAGDFRCVVERERDGWRVRACILQRISSRPRAAPSSRRGAAELAAATVTRDVQGSHRSSVPLSATAGALLRAFEKAACS